MLILIVLQAIADPTGLLALVGWSGAIPSLATGFWTFAPYLVFIPVVLAVTWWVSLRAGDRFWTLSAGITLAVLLAQAATTLVMAGNLAVAGWAAGFVAAKAVPAALIVAAFTRWFGGPRDLTRHTVVSIWPAAALFAVVTPLLAGLWWTGAAYTPGIPTARIDRGALSVVLTVLLVAGATALCLRPVRARVPGVLGGWIAAVLAGGLVGLIQAAIGLLVDRGFDGDVWPLMVAYVAVADGIAFGACLGWIVGLTALASDRIRQTRSDRAPLARETNSGVEDTVGRMDPARTSKREMAAPATILAIATVAAVAASLIAPATEQAAAALPEPALGAEQDPPAAGILRAEAGRIVDGLGNQVLLRGVNVNQLVDFYQPQPDVPATRPLSEADFAGMAEYGFNVVRLNISWSALEPTRGALDEGYLAEIDQAVEWAAEHGIYTVLDMHQDGWWNGPSDEGTVCRPGTEPMWGYDGAPEWATITDSAPRCQFTGRDISPAGNRAFQNFFFNTDGVRTALAETWGALAERYRDEPMIAGYDLLNEPGFGETASVTTSYLLGQFYTETIDEIRAAGAEQIVFFEPSIFWSGLGFDSGPPSGFTADTNIVFSPHLYAESITMDRDLGIPPIVGIERQFTLAERVAAEYDAPLWSGEYGYWGAEKTNWGEDADSLARMARYAAAEDERMLGSAYWVWKQACGDPQNGIGPVGNALMMQDCEDGGVLPPKAGLLEILSRAYPQQAPGVLTSLRGDGAALQLAGVASQPGCGLTVWVPGKVEPRFDSTGITELSVQAVSGGWVVTGCAAGEYSLETVS